MQSDRSTTILVPLLGGVLVAAVVASAWLAWQPSGDSIVARADTRVERDEAGLPATMPPTPAFTSEPSAAPPAPPEVPDSALPAAVDSAEPPPIAEPIAPLPTPASEDSQPARPAAPSPAAEGEHANVALAESANISGTWLLSNEVHSTSYAPFRGLRLAYRARLVQDGSKVVGSGVKWAENGRTLPDSQRTPISFEGHIEDHTVSLRFSEQGKRRTSRGVLTWNLAPGGDEMRGTFSSSAASSSGVSSARRLPG